MQVVTRTGFLTGDRYDDEDGDGDLEGWDGVVDLGGERNVNEQGYYTLGAQPRLMDRKVPFSTKVIIAACWFLLESG